MTTGTRRLRTPEALGSPVVLRPFAALRLDAQRVGDPQASRAFARPYREVAERLKSWQRAGYVHADPTPALYLHEYTANGLTARGLVGLLDLTRRVLPGDPVGVFPHEDVHPEQVMDLADRMDEMEMNPAPILLVHSGSPDLRSLVEEVASTAPLTTFTCRQGTRNRVWAITDPEQVRIAQGQLATSQLMIADGHHRYGAYLEMQRRHGDAAHDQGLAMVVDQNDTPLFLGAIHRSLPRADVPGFLAAARAHGATVSPIGAEAALPALSPRCLVLHSNQGWMTMCLPAPEPATPGTGLASPVEWLDDVFDSMGEPAIDYHHSVESALSVPGDHLSVLLPAPDFTRITDLARHGAVLPQKATSFLPKPPVGVLMRPLTPST